MSTLGEEYAEIGVTSVLEMAYGNDPVAVNSGIERMATTGRLYQIADGSADIIEIDRLGNEFITGADLSGVREAPLVLAVHEAICASRNISKLLIAHGSQSETLADMPNLTTLSAQEDPTVEQWKALFFANRSRLALISMRLGGYIAGRCMEPQLKPVAINTIAHLFGAIENQAQQKLGTLE